VWVSVHAAALRQAGHASLPEGLRSLAVRRLELGLSPQCELPSLEAGEAPAVSVGTPGAARAYRQALYEHAIEVSAVWTAPDECQSGTGSPAAGSQVAEALGARVLRLPSAPPPASVDDAVDEESSWARAAALADQATGARTVLAVPWPTPALRLALPAGIVADDRVDWQRVGLGLDVAALWESETGEEAAWDLLKWAAPFVRHVVCRALSRAPAAPLGGGGPDYARLASILGAAGYAGPLAIGPRPEGLTPSEAQVLLRLDAAHLKDVVGEY
jgi:hypothetical protein